MIGPRMYSHTLVRSPATSIGPRERAGLTEPPVTGPAMKTPTASAKERGGTVSVPPLPHLADRDYVRLRVRRAVDHFEPICPRAGPAVGGTDTLRIRS